MMLFGRRIIPTTLDPVPRNFRAAPGVLAMNHAEISAIERRDEATEKRLAAICFAEGRADALLAMQTPKPRRRKLGPSTRLSMLNAIYRGRAA